MRPLSVVSLVLLSSGCSLNHFVTNKLGDALAAPSTSYSADNDPELIASAAPFSLKLIESTLEGVPRHEGLLLAAASGFTQYGYAFIEQSADFIEATNLDSARTLRRRARAMYLRGRDYGLRGLAVRHPGFESQVHQDIRAALSPMRGRDVPLLYWTAAAWGAAVSLSKDMPEMLADQRFIEALIDRAYELDPAYDFGSLDAFLITYELVRPDGVGDAVTRSRSHFDLAVARSLGGQAAPYVTYAEQVCVYRQERSEFEEMLRKALAVNVDSFPRWRLANLIMQRRARWLLSREPELFFDAADSSHTQR